MKPAFTKLTCLNDGKAVKVDGPIPLSGNETEAYLWVHITQSRGNPEAARNREMAEAVGTGDMDRDALKREFDAASARLARRINSKTAASPKHKVTGSEASDAAETATAMWTVTAATTEGTFHKGSPARIEAWALVRTREPTRVFHVYWQENEVKVQ